MLNRLCAIYLFSLLVFIQRPCNAQPTLLSCIYGYAQCLGLQDDDGLAKAQELGCPTSAAGEHAGASQSNLERMFSQITVRQGLSLPDGSVLAYGDGMPCTFSPEDDWDTVLSQINSISQVDVTLSDGSKAVVSGATWLPATEPNEQRTLLLFGDFGYARSLQPTSVSIAGSEPYTGAGLNYDNQGEHLLWVKWDDVAVHEAGEGSGQNIDQTDRCSAAFPSTTHVLQVAMNGGIAVTYDGNEELPERLKNEHHKGLFQILINAGSGAEAGPPWDVHDLPSRVLTSSEYLGLADINDSDNIADLCLNLVGDALQEATTQGLSVKVVSTRDCFFIVPPKGDCMNPLVTANCGDSSAEAQEICVSNIPGISCPYGTQATVFTPTAEDLSGLTCPDTQHSDGHDHAAPPPSGTPTPTPPTPSSSPQIVDNGSQSIHPTVAFGLLVMCVAAQVAARG